jgi:dihydropteroate synthase
MATKVKIAGILNVTPDSFSDGGKFFSLKKALVQAKKLIAAGADIIDVGGESSGPNSTFVPVDEELRRVIPVVLSLRALLFAEGKRKRGNLLFAKQCPLACRLLRRNDNNVIISVDTYKSKVAVQAIAAGTKIINDVTALRGDPKMAGLIAKTGVKIILMYSKDQTARTTRTKKRYKDVIKTIKEFLKERVEFALSQGIKRSQIILDPGMGAFISGDPKYSLEVIRRLGELKDLGFPVLVGISRKSCLPGPLAERDAATFAANLVAIQNGADIIRVHEVSTCYNK